MSSLYELKEELRSQIRNPNMIKSYSDQKDAVMTVEVKFGGLIDFNDYLRKRIVSMYVRNAVVDIKFAVEPVEEVEL